MTHNFKPGNVALLEVGCHANRQIGMRLAAGWAHAAGVNADGDGVIDVARPLVVIDAEDREQVERLMNTYMGQFDSYPPSTTEADHMQAALREFANPTPPKPDEPTGLGAVVEGVNGDRWTRVDSSDLCDRAWVCEADDEVVPFAWSNIAVVRVLSEGVQS